MCLNPVYEAPEIEYCVNKTGIKALVCADKFKHHDYYETLLAIAPELKNCELGKLESKKVPSLKIVIRISEDVKRYLVTRYTRYLKNFTNSTIVSRGTYNFHELLNLANPSEVANIQKLQHSISPDDGCSLYMTSVRFLLYFERQVLMQRHFRVLPENQKPP